MVPGPLHRSLVVLEVVAFATLLRSIAYDRWITVLGALLLLAGAGAAHRGRAWGVALAFATAVGFPVAAAIGMAPAWFVFVGIAGMMPFALTWRAFARVDRSATAVLAAIAASCGTLVALGWNQLAWEVVGAFPSLYPSMDARHGLVVAVLGAIGATLGLLRLYRSESSTGTRVGISGHRIAVPTLEASPISATDEVEHDERWEQAAKKARRST